MSKHYQFESNMSLTGSNADVRIPIKPSQEGKVVAALFGALSGQSVSADGIDAAMIAKIADELKANAGASLVVSGSNDANIQRVVLAINKMLNNYGATINMDAHLNLFAGNDTAVGELVSEMNAGTVNW